MHTREKFQDVQLKQPKYPALGNFFTRLLTIQTMGCSAAFKKKIKRRCSRESFTDETKIFGMSCENKGYKRQDFISKNVCVKDGEKEKD